MIKNVPMQSTDGKKFGKLKWAIFHGKREIIESLLENNTPVNNTCHAEDFRSPLHSSLYLGDPGIVKKLLEKGACVNKFGWDNETALTLATKLEKFDLVDLMLSDRLENRANNENLTHLHIACIRNRVDVVKKLIRNGIDINTSVKSKSIRWPGYTPLHFAVKFRAVETVALLLSIGADITIQDSNQLTALHLADMTRDERMIDMILLAHKKVATNPVNSEGLSHFHIACTRNNLEVFQCFLNNGVALEHSVNETSLQWPKYTAIDFAMYYDCVDIVRALLLEGGREKFPSSCEGFNRLTKAYCSGNVELLNLFLWRDDLNKNKGTAIKGLSKLHFSCIHYGIGVISEALLQVPSELNKPNWQGSTPLHLAIECRSEAIIEFLLIKGADCNIKNADGKTSLHLAFERKMNKVVRLILEGLDLIEENHVDNNGLSWLHIACIVNNVEAVLHLIKLGADVNIPVNFDSVIWPGFTPLHFAAKFMQPKIANILLEHGASYCAIDRYGLTAFDIAIFEFHSFYQDRNRELFDTMRAILLSHEKNKNDHFNDRGFSLLHVLFPKLDDILDDDREGDYRWDLRKFIREHPGDLNKPVHKLNTPWDGYTPLHFAMLEYEPDHAVILVEMGADLWAKAANGDTPMHISTYEIMPKIPDDTCGFDELQHNPVAICGESLFHVACKFGDVKWVEYFLNHGVDPNSRNTVQGLEYLDNTPLHLATRARGAQKRRVVELLLNKGADAKARNHHLNTTLHEMECSVDTETIDLLINHGVDVNSRNAFWETPLVSICRRPDDFSGENLGKMVQSLLNHGADINLASEQGLTALSIISSWDSHHTLNRFSTTIQMLLYQVIKLRVMGLYVSEVNETAFWNLWQRFNVQFKNALSAYTFRSNNEVKLLKEVRTDVYTTLYDIMFKSLNALCVISGNSELKKIIDSDDFEKTFPIYGQMLKLQLKKGEERKPLLVDTVKVFKYLINMSLPQECIERILQFLDNDDLKNLMKIVAHDIV
ncbi:hypothetical protein QAD02_015939 [Eretmocerus hayati]|uniref:Uncharacterized protein n=1 Tax=Eretmocerus hayati TaxID=131215 RepID=A0ACC2PA27_9HYME|nr:hypothetical protein QAD02_015939 [Eretmocerus hayati]